MADFYTFGSGGLQEAVRQVFAKLKTLLDGKYTKPVGGIPASDMAQAVQTSLDKADTALQEHQSLAAYRTAAAQDVIDAAQEEEIDDLHESKAPVILSAASGNPANFTDGADNMQIRKIVANIELVQSGSGDPSPDNVRPIRGWTGCNIYQSGADTSNPTTFPISWETVAGMVYGGTLTANEDGGKLNDECDMGILDGSADVMSVGVSSIGSRRFATITMPQAVTLIIACSNYKIANPSTQYNELSYDVRQRKMFIYDNRFTSVNAVKEVFAANPVQVLFKKASTALYDLTDIPVLKTILGTNNIWADCGNVEVTYRADTKLYIDNKITQAIANALNS